MSQWIARNLGDGALGTLTADLDDALLNALRNGVASTPEGERLLDAFDYLGNARKSRWFGPYSATESEPDAKKRTLGWPDLADDETFTHDGGNGDLTLTLTAKGGIYFSVDRQGDSEDEIDGSSGVLALSGDISAEFATDQNFTVSAGDIGLGVSAKWQAREGVAWHFSLEDNDERAAVVAASVLRRVGSRPWNYDETSTLLGDTHDGVQVRQIALSRYRAKSGSVNLTIPFSLALGSGGTLSGSMTSSSTHDNTLKISHVPAADGQSAGLKVSLDGKKTLSQSRSFGLKFNASISGLDTGSLSAFAGELEKGGDILKSIDNAAFGEQGGGLTMLKPAKSIFEKAESSAKQEIQDLINVDGIKARIAAALDVGVSDVQARLADILADTFDDELDFLGLESPKELAKAATDKLGVAELTGKLDAAAEALTGKIDARIEAAVEHLEQETDETIREALSLDEDDRATLTAVRETLDSARQVVAKILSTVGDDQTLSIALDFSRIRSKDKSVTALAEFVFWPAGAEKYTRLVSEPIPFVSKLMDETIDPAKMSLAGSIKGATKKKLTRKLAVNIGDISFSDTASGFNDIEWELTSNGVTMFGKGGASSTSKMFGDETKFRVANVVTLNGRAGALAPADDDKDGISVQLARSVDEDLGLDDIGDFTDPLVNSGLISDGYRDAVVDAIEASRAAAGGGKTPGGIKLDLRVSEAITEKLAAMAAKLELPVASLAGEGFLFDDSFFSNLLAWYERDTRYDSPGERAEFLAIEIANGGLRSRWAQSSNAGKNKIESLENIHKSLWQLEKALAASGNLIGRANVTQQELDAVNDEFAALSHRIKGFGATSRSASRQVGLMRALQILAQKIGEEPILPVISFQLDGGDWQIVLPT